MADKNFEFPQLNLSVGDVRSFAISIAFSSFPGASLPTDDASCVLLVTDGYLTFFAGGIDVFEVDGEGGLPPLLMTHSRFSLSMFLEWILYDKAYLPCGGAVSFSELVGGESSPDVLFRLADDIVTISWDLSDWSRNGLKYKVKVGTAHVEYWRYLACLCLAFDSVLVACEGRARSAGVAKQWFAWLEGYAPEAKSFREHVGAVCWHRGCHWLGTETRTENGTGPIKQR